MNIDTSRHNVDAISLTRSEESDQKVYGETSNEGEHNGNSWNSRKVGAMSADCRKLMENDVSEEEKDPRAFLDGSFDVDVQVITPKAILLSPTETEEVPVELISLPEPTETLDVDDELCRSLERGKAAIEANLALLKQQEAEEDGLFRQLRSQLVFSIQKHADQRRDSIFSFRKNSAQRSYEFIKALNAASNMDEIASALFEFTNRMGVYAKFGHQLKVGSNSSMICVVNVLSGFFNQVHDGNKSELLTEGVLQWQFVCQTGIRKSESKLKANLQRLEQPSSARVSKREVRCALIDKLHLLNLKTQSVEADEIAGGILSDYSRFMPPQIVLKEFLDNSTERRLFEQLVTELKNKIKNTFIGEKDIKVALMQFRQQIFNRIFDSLAREYIEAIKRQYPDNSEVCKKLVKNVEMQLKNSEFSKRFNIPEEKQNAPSAIAQVIQNYLVEHSKDKYAKVKHLEQYLKFFEGEDCEKKAGCALENKIALLVSRSYFYDFLTEKLDELDRPTLSFAKYSMEVKKFLVNQFSQGFRAVILEAQWQAIQAEIAEVGL